jgi:acyl-coenzyme A thioesterase PaaI-like protein
VVDIAVDNFIKPHFMNFEKHLAAARKSKFGLFRLNFGLGLLVPFNRPHRIKIAELGDDYVKTIIPYRRKNFNHIRGIHACGLATAAEFASGFMLVSKLDGKKYRLIMESLEMKYHYQAKADVFAKFSATPAWFEEKIIIPLQAAESILVRCEINLHDKSGNHVATGYTNWQIKDWAKVRTKV